MEQEEEGDSTETTTDEDMSVSVNALTGNIDFYTFKVKGTEYGHEVQILIDGSSTHCILDVEVVSKTSSYRMRTLTLGGCYMVLVVDWLRLYNPLEYDYNAMIVTVTVTVYRNGKKWGFHALTQNVKLHFISTRNISEMVSGENFRKSINGYGVISKPLTELLRNDNFRWIANATDVFERLKQALTFALVLALPDFTKIFVVEADACEKSALYGYLLGPLTIDPYIPTTQPEVEEYLQKHSKLLELLKLNLTEAQDQMKTYAHKHKTKRSFVVGDSVYLKLQPYRHRFLTAKEESEIGTKILWAILGFDMDSQRRGSSLPGVNVTTITGGRRRNSRRPSASKSSRQIKGSWVEGNDAVLVKMGNST
ncbi:UNVERIFIED_CONTAM: hypothetical protein Scaly_0670300 [Sesamum calycinum]|uniref:Uncharacterized protein n=1 Tax=Sesamum calycinum TaxID=2727403 RepID=A0AAW2R5Y4_9LAMI